MTEPQQSPPQVEITLWPGQARLIQDRDHFEHGLVSGVGYGKSTFGPPWFHSRCILNKDSKLSLIVAPKYDLVKTVNLEYYVDFLESVGYENERHFTVNKSELSLTYFFGHKILFRSAETWKRLVAYNASHFWIDEAGLCPPEIRREVVKRTRCPKAQVRQGLYTGTPEGINWYSQLFSPGELVRTGRFSESDSKLVLHGVTMDNPTLPPDYFDNLRDAFGWNEALWKAYVLGEFVPLFENNCYDFSATENVTDCRPDPSNRTVFLSWDFNVGQVSWGAFQQARGTHYLVAENRKQCRDTDQACDQFLETFKPDQWDNEKIGRLDLQITGDSSGWARDTRNRVDNDYAIIKQRLTPHFPRLSLRTPSSNPPVSASILATNRMFARKLLFFDRNCGKHISSAQSTVFDGKGGITKPSGDQVTHPMDDCRYYVNLVAPAIDRTQFGKGISF